jgi:DNA recombination protein RmuC
MMMELILLVVLVAFAAATLVIIMRKGDAAVRPLLDRVEAAERSRDQMEARLRGELAQNRTELSATVKSFNDSLVTSVDRMVQTVDAKLTAIQSSNTQKLDEMRKTVDEQLSDVLGKRLGESFKQVSERLEQVHKGLGEMRTLAGNVDGLKRVLTNVKERGTWGEIQLGALLEQVLTIDQFGRNVITRPGSRDPVEYAVKLPGRDADGVVWLPIDAKFPKEDYERLMDAADKADAAALEEASKALETRIKQCAKDIKTKYVAPPATTDFAIMFLPTEGLYSEVLRRPGRVVPAGPTTLAAILSSLQMGFRTLAIERRSSEVWEVLSAVKTEFAAFGEAMEKAQKKIVEAGNVIEGVQVRKRAVEKRLKQVEVLPEADATRLLTGE